MSPACDATAAITKARARRRTTPIPAMTPSPLLIAQRRVTAASDRTTSSRRSFSSLAQPPRNVAPASPAMNEREGEERELQDARRLAEVDVRVDDLT